MNKENFKIELNKVIKSFPYFLENYVKVIDSFGKFKQVKLKNVNK
jgi:hypothetical protein